ncbi:hypothetical protein TSMEX_009559 [Taenia solium]|eukprot:TsM_000441800 transcript=TsM_000441800 gene=TsM_000441800
MPTPVVLNNEFWSHLWMRVILLAFFAASLSVFSVRQPVNRYIRSRRRNRTPMTWKRQRLFQNYSGCEGESDDSVEFHSHIGFAFTYASSKRSRSMKSIAPQRKSVKRNGDGCAGGCEYQRAPGEGHAAPLGGRADLHHHTAVTGASSNASQRGHPQVSEGAEFACGVWACLWTCHVITTNWPTVIKGTERLHLVPFPFHTGTMMNHLVDSDGGSKIP